MRIILKYDEKTMNEAEILQLNTVILPSILRWAVNDDHNHPVAANFKTEIATYWAYKYMTKTGKVVAVDVQRHKTKNSMDLSVE